MQVPLRCAPGLGYQPSPPHHNDSFPSASRKKGDMPMARLARRHCCAIAPLPASRAFERCVSRAMLTTAPEPHVRLVLVLVAAVAVCKTGTPVPRSPASRLCERWGKGCVSLGCSPYTYLPTWTMVVSCVPLQNHSNHSVFPSWAFWLSASAFRHFQVDPDALQTAWPAGCMAADCFLSNHDKGTSLSRRCGPRSFFMLRMTRPKARKCLP
ncbi:hypothetical protein BC567DRAFT_57857 [Phyllosticta citribraziliensis]